MSNKELANAFAIAKVCGFDKSIDEFQKCIPSTIMKPSRN